MSAPFYLLFPDVIWSEISLLVPTEIFILCEKLYLPYRYATSINLPYNISPPSSLKNYRRLVHFTSVYSFIPLNMPLNLRTITFRSLIRGLIILTLEPLRNCSVLRKISIRDFNGSLEPLRGCLNLQEIEVYMFDGDLEPLRGLKN